ncbi:hypothetical protein [Azospirillum sp. Marseille-Q6669]
MTGAKQGEMAPVSILSETVLVIPSMAGFFQALVSAWSQLPNRIRKQRG